MSDVYHAPPERDYLWLKLGVAVLDDYQDAALQMTDWSSLSPDTEFRSSGSLSDLDAVAERCKDFAIVVAMRERNQFSSPVGAITEAQISCYDGHAQRSD